MPVTYIKGDYISVIPSELLPNHIDEILLIHLIYPNPYSEYMPVKFIYDISTKILSLYWLSNNLHATPFNKPIGSRIIEISYYSKQLERDFKIDKILSP